MRAGYPELWRNVGWFLRALKMVVKAPSQEVTKGKSKRTQPASEDGMVGHKPTSEVSCFLAKVARDTAIMGNSEAIGKTGTLLVVQGPPS